MGGPIAPVTVAVPGSKSVTHRAFLLGALSSVPCRVEGPLLGADCRSTLAVLGGLGARLSIEGGSVQFEPIADLRPADGTLDCGNSGTTLRLMLGQLARLPGATRLTGDDSLRSRPNGPLLDALRAAGAEVDAVEGRAPVVIKGPMTSGAMTLPPRVSSQYASSLMLAAALLDGPSVLSLPAPVASRPYLDLTREVAAAFGLALHFEPQSDGGLVVRIPGGQRPKAARYAVEGDWSGAAFPLVAGALLSRPVILTGLRTDSAQGDRAVVDIIRRFGPGVAWRAGGLALDPTPLKAAGVVDLGPTPDLFPPLVALAALAEGVTTFAGAPSLRHKECDRIAAMAEGLARLGIECRERPDGLVVRGGRLAPSDAMIRSFHDHRIHMAFSVLARRAAGGVEVDGRGCEAVSYPEFHRDLDRVAGSVA